MNPLLATGLVSIGSRLIDSFAAANGLKSAQQAPAPVATSAPQAAPKPPSELSNYLNERGVQDAVGLKNLQFHLSQQLANHPDLANFMNSLEPGAPLQIKAVDGGMFQISTLDGRTYAFGANSELGQMAQRLQQVQQLNDANRRLPGTSLGDLANSDIAKPALNASWMLVN